MSVNRPILEVFKLVTKRFPPALCESYRHQWGRLSLYCEPDPLWFVLWDPEKVEYVWEYRGYEIQIAWKPGRYANLIFSGTPPQETIITPEQLNEGSRFGVEVSEKAIEVRGCLRQQLLPIPRGKAKEYIRSLEEVITDVYERRVGLYAADSSG